MSGQGLASGKTCRALRRVALSCAVALAMASQVEAARAARGLSEQRDTLFQQSLKHPKDVALALEYARVCIELKDPEGAIGALERVLFFRPDDAELKAQLGFLYYQLHSHQMAKQYFDAAGSASLDADTRAKIDEIAPAIETETTGTRAFAFLQTGVRYQTNAAFNPDNNILRLSNQDFIVTHPGSTGSDWNGFQLFQAGYDYSLGDQRGDMIEARVTGYATEQFRFTDLDVGLYDVSIGPRLAIAPNAFPGWTIKPYVVGGQVFLAGSRYLASAGAGIVADLPVKSGFLVEPGLEIRHLDFNNASIFSSLNSGTSISVSAAAEIALNETWSLHGRIAYSRDAAAFSFQSSDNVGEEIALTASFVPSMTGLATTWSVSPYLKLLQTSFDGPNPFIDSSTTRHDQEIQVGAVLDTPVFKRFSLVTNVQFAKVDSNIPNYRLRNISVLTGPTVRF